VERRLASEDELEVEIEGTGVVDSAGVVCVDAVDGVGASEAAGVFDGAGPSESDLDSD